MHDRKIQRLATILSTVTISLVILLLAYYSLQGNVERINKEKEEQAIVLCEYETETEQSAEAPAGVIKHYNVKIDHVGNRDYYLFFYTIHHENLSAFDNRPFCIASIFSISDFTH